MDKGKYTYAGLKEKYKQYTTPDCEIRIDGTLHKEKSMMVSALEVELTAGYEAGGCTFRILNGYSPKKGGYTDGWLDKILVPGKLVEVKLGYIKKEVVFYGFINSVINQFDGENGATILVSCMDGKGAMMAGKHRIFGGEKKLTDIVKEILNQYMALKVVKKVTVDNLTDLKRQVFQNCQTDYDFLVAVARKLGYEFFIVKDEVMFVKPRKIKDPIMVFTWGENIMSFTREIDLTEQLKEVKVIGNDEKEKKEIVGKASTITKTGQKAASDLYDLVKKRTETIYDPAVRTLEEANALAKSILEDYSMQYVSGYGECVGIPELIPGRFVKMERFDKTINGSYYIKKVTHIFDENGYKTRFEVGANSV
ncbi:MAG: phage late control D family protein [Acetivibrionales bacterium]